VCNFWLLTFKIVLQELATLPCVAYGKGITAVPHELALATVASTKGNFLALLSAISFKVRILPFIYLVAIYCFDFIKINSIFQSLAEDVRCTVH
jgi:hypothetical protein